MGKEKGKKLIVTTREKEREDAAHRRYWHMKQKKRNGHDNTQKQTKQTKDRCNTNVSIHRSNAKNENPHTHTR